MADEQIIPIDGTDDSQDGLTSPVAGLQPREDDAEAAQDETATSEQDETASDDDPKRLKSQIAGFRGRVTQQEKELKALRAEFTAAKAAADDAKAARAELERVRHESAQAVQRNQIEVEIRDRAQRATQEYAQSLELRGVILDDQTRDWMLQDKFNSVYTVERERLERATTDTKLTQTTQETQRERAAREFREQSVAARDKVVAREAAKLSKQLKSVGVERVITPGEIIAQLKEDVTSPTGIEELQDVAEHLYDAAIADAKKERRKAGIAERDAGGTDLFERGGSPSLSPAEIIRRWGDGDSSVTYPQVKQAEKALGYR